MKKITNDLLKESYYYEKLDNGLRVYLWPKEDFNKTFGLWQPDTGQLIVNLFL